jgi:ArsR family transcriptional regulator
MGIDDVFAVIAEGTRRQILRHLRDGDKAVGELVVELQVSQPTVSKHLKVLREAGLVTMRAQGQKRYYSLDPAPLGHVRAWLAGFDPEEVLESSPADAVPERDVLPEPVPETVSDALDAAGPEQEGADVLAAAVLAGPGPAEIEIPRPQIGRTMGRAAERAADLLSQLRRRRDPSS